MNANCVKCGRQMPEGRREWECDECIALASEGETVEVVLELTQSELHVVATALEQEATTLQHRGGDWKFEAETLKKVAEAFRTAPEDERRRKAGDAHVQWRQSLE